MPHFTFRTAAAALAFIVGLASVWLSGLLAAPVEAGVAEWLVPTADINVPAGPFDGREVDDTRKVYETVLREVFKGGDPARPLVVRSQTMPYPFTEGQARTFQDVSAEALDDYHARHRLPKLVPPLHGLGAPVTLLGWDEPGSTFRERRAKRWAAFHRRFPHLLAYVEFSPVGFNLAGDEAFLYAARNCGESCSEGNFLWLRKSAGRWQVVCEGWCGDY